MAPEAPWISPFTAATSFNGVILGELSEVVRDRPKRDLLALFVYLAIRLPLLGDIVQDLLPGLALPNLARGPESLVEPTLR